MTVSCLRLNSLRRLSLLLFCCLLTPLPIKADDFQGSTHMVPFDEETINYNKTQPDSAISRLQKQIESGKTNLKFDDQYGYLLSVLEQLNIPRSSQMLVFSKTSFQRDRISPTTPRALYFNDDVYIGFIPGSPTLEISVADPKMGGVFYTLNQSKTNNPSFVRTDQCLECHASSKSMGVPGHILRSFMTDSTGATDLKSGISEINHRTPLSDRWGGWYVTGTHGKQTHRGNLIGEAAFERQEKEPNYLGNLTDLSRFFETSKYPQPSSDIVALMVLEHQVHMHNYITRLNFEATLSLQAYGHVRYLKTIEDAFLRYLLFTEEIPLTEPITGNSGFTKTFSDLGPKDKLGRSLRDFDLKTRLFKYPCSFLIYSESFDKLPDKMRDHIYERLWEILTGKDTSPDFQGISAEQRQAILEILIATKPGLPDYWKQK